VHSPIPTSLDSLKALSIRDRSEFSVSELKEFNGTISKSFCPKAVENIKRRKVTNLVILFLVTANVLRVGAYPEGCDYKLLWDG
jgi:hypothetical protein